MRCGIGMVDTIRYARHISLPDVGIDGQRKINDAKVLVIGAGGLGSPVLLYLAAAGIGKIGIIDDDVVDLTNLQRQIIHSQASIGKNKAMSAIERINSLNPSIETQYWTCRLGPDNADEIFQGWDLVIDGTDNIPTRYLIDATCQKLGIPWIYGSIYRFEGQVSVFNYRGGPSYFDLFPEPPPANSIPSCADGGVFGILPGVIGSLQATEALKIILSRGNVLSGKLLLYDADLMEFKTLNFAKSNPEASHLDLKTITKLFEDSGWCAFQNQSSGEIQEPTSTGEDMFNHLSVAEYKQKKSDGWQPFLIDVRSIGEYEQQRVSFTDLQVAHEEIVTKVDEIPKDRDIILLCRSGMRSQMAAMFLIHEGYSGDKLYNFDGGIMAWSSQLPADIE